MPNLPSLDQRDADQSPQQDDEETFRFASSWLSEGTYSPSRQTLDLTYVKGGETTYTKVPPDVWANLKTAVSPGRFYKANIQGRFSWL
jgi:hypothetical protein